MSSISVVILSHRRHENIPILVKRIQNQTVKPKEIIVWNNYDENKIDIKIPGIKCINSTYNFKFFARWIVGLLCNSEYLATLDDDCPPGPKWFEHSIQLMNKQPGLYGRAGRIIGDVNNYCNLIQSVDCQCLDKEPVQVDFCGQAWFLKREWLSSIMKEAPPFFDNGEDIFLSYICQKHLGIKTFIPFSKNPECLPYWNSNELKYLNTQRASFILNEKDHDSKRTQMVQWCVAHGWKLIKK